MKRRTRKRRPRVNNKPKNKKSCSPLFWSSLIFTTNMIHAFIAGLYFYSLCFASLTITSLVVHTEYNIYTNIIDRVAIASIILYGGYRMWSKIDGTHRTSVLLFLCVLTFVASVGLYIYKQSMTDDATIYHEMMHYICSIGHHIILLL